MKGGVAVQLALAAELPEPTHDVTFVFYDHEEVEADRNGLGRLVREHPDWLQGDFAVLCEPTNGGLEGGCNGTLRVEVAAGGRRGALGAGLDGPQRHPRRGRGAAPAGGVRAAPPSRSTGWCTARA